MSWLIDASAVHHSGALTHYLGILPALDRLPGSEEVHVLASDSLARALDGRINTLRLDVLTSRKGVGRVAALHSRVRASVRNQRPDAAMFSQYAPLAVGVPYVLRMTDAHLIDTTQRNRLMRFYTPLQRIGWRVKVAAFRHSVRRAGAVLCATRAVRDQLAAAHPELDPARLHVAHYGLSPLATPSVRHPGPRGTRMLTMHLSPRKNVEAILEAMALPGMEAFELTVLGDLERPATPYTRFLADRARSLGVAARVRSAGYISDPERLRRCLLEHDVLLCPSRIESWSHTVVEGMALGIPVVASDIACHREVSAGAAWLAPCDDPGALAGAVREAVGGGADVRDRIERGIDVARGYDWTAHAQAMLRALRAAAGTGP